MPFLQIYMYRYQVFWHSPIIFGKAVKFKIKQLQPLIK